MTRRSGDNGSATVLMLAGMGLIALAAAVVCCIGVAITVRHRAASAADAAALAAAARAADGPVAACAQAARLASADGARLSGCALDGPIASVSVTVTPGGWLAKLGAAKVEAKAGPAETKGKNLGHPPTAS